MSVATELIRLNIGAGNVRLREGYVTLDNNPQMEPDILATVPPLPLGDESVLSIYCSHMLEHLTNDAACELMREAWRVLVPGGEFEIIVPYALSHGAFQDPTHRSFWVPERFLYHTPHFRYLGYGLEDRFELRILGLDADNTTVTAVLVKAVS